MSREEYRFSVDGMTCGSCGMLVDDAVEDVPGVRRSRTSVRSGVCAVELEDDGTAVTTDAIIGAIGRAGYRAVRVGA